ncbi:hypothetical protein IEQ34_019469 [Dendrobium chrysotoxum]|uniref:Uncharacterized protein n=1 Tax=Dendrobium chrysotoxum TaxID=161865 RepID=A0AAV7G7U6_DENCH|nr:hypothetical protein IEQ34_019469 [Dendrobium chrysotoxum]
MLGPHLICNHVDHCGEQNCRALTGCSRCKEGAEPTIVRKQQFDFEQIWKEDPFICFSFCFYLHSFTSSSPPLLLTHQVSTESKAELEEASGNDSVLEIEDYQGSGANNRHSPPSDGN